MTRSSGAVGCADDEVVSKPANKEGQWRVLAIRAIGEFLPGRIAGEF